MGRLNGEKTIITQSHFKIVVYKNGTSLSYGFKRLPIFKNAPQKYSTWYFNSFLLEK